jgi:serine/threonine protein kinase/tetratricopeptide (TPR) repeat protein
MPFGPGTKIGPYEILASIGAGGMGEVWKARDTRLGRIVAIKKVKEQHSERFKQEARSIAALNHSNICQLFDIGPDYLVLEYIDGKPLSSPLPEKEAVRLAIQIAAALVEAHQKGIIHRDLKPANILVTDKGSVKLLDFGLAKLYEQDAANTQSPTLDYAATQAGAVLGTIAYMSPEQAQGRPADARSDIFSFGLVLYEMLSGRRAFSGDSNYAIMDGIVKGNPPPLQTSAVLEKIVQCCLAKHPSERFQTMSEVNIALEQVFKEKLAQSPVEQQPSIAVLPFVNMSGDKEQEYFSDGLAEEIINTLAQISGIKVIARTSAFAFRGKEQDITKIAQALRVRTILEGSVRRSGNRVRITAQLIDATEGSHLWSERFDREMTDVFAIQDEISQAIAEKLRIHLSGSRHLIKRYTENLEAYSLYLKGRYYLNKLTPEGMMKGKQHFEQALAADANFALAWAGLADFYHRNGSTGQMPPEATKGPARQAVLKALELDEALPEAHALMGVLHADAFAWKEAEREFQRALELGPNSPDAALFYIMFYLMPMRRWNEAVGAMRRVLELDPLSSMSQQMLGVVYLAAGHFELAIEQSRNSLELDPHYFWPYLIIALAADAAGKTEEAIQACERSVELAGRPPVLVGCLGRIYAEAGRMSQAQSILDELFELSQKTYVPASAISHVYFGLNQMDKAFDWMEKAIHETPGLFFLYTRGASSARLHSHPRYHALLRKMNLEP